MSFQGVLRDNVGNKHPFLKLHNIPIHGATVKSKQIINADLMEVEGAKHWQ
jgi:hypothetical protein